MISDNQLVDFLKSHGNLSTADIQTVVGHYRAVRVRAEQAEREVSELRTMISGARTALQQQTRGLREARRLIEDMTKR